LQLFAVKRKAKVAVDVMKVTGSLKFGLLMMESLLIES